MPRCSWFAACTLDSECPTNDVCHNGQCNHNHKPDPASLQMVRDAFARHGVALHIAPNPHEVPHSEVITFAKAGDPDNGPKAICAGADVQAGGLGGFAVSFFDVKARYFEPRRAPAYHYTVFSHFATCLTDTPGVPGDCGQCPLPRTTPRGFPPAGSAGFAELPGNDLIVSLGSRYYDLRIHALPLTEGGVLMHELGHNLGLDHAGDPSDPRSAPNYLRGMNDKYVFHGIQEGAALGSSTPKRALPMPTAPWRTNASSRQPEAPRSAAGLTIPITS